MLDAPTIGCIDLRSIRLRDATLRFSDIIAMHTLYYPLDEKQVQQRAASEHAMWAQEETQAEAVVELLNTGLLKTALRKLCKTPSVSAGH